MKRFAFLLLFVVGCAVQQSPVSEDSLAETVADHEVRLTKLEGGDPPSPSFDNDWQQLGHEAGVASAHLRARLLTEAASIDFGGDASAMDAWLHPRLTAGETLIFNKIRKAKDAAMSGGYDEAKHKQINAELAKGYGAVK